MFVLSGIKGKVLYLYGVFSLIANSYIDQSTECLLQE